MIFWPNLLSCWRRRFVWPFRSHSTRISTFDWRASQWQWHFAPGDHLNPAAAQCAHFDRVTIETLIARQARSLLTGATYCAPLSLPESFRSLHATRTCSHRQSNSRQVARRRCRSRNDTAAAAAGRVGQTGRRQAPVASAATRLRVQLRASGAPSAAGQR